MPSVPAEDKAAMVGTVPSGEEVVVAYLGTYLSRMERRDGLVFRRLELDGLALTFLREITGRLGRQIARDVVARTIDSLSDALAQTFRADARASHAAYAWIAARGAAGLPLDPDALRVALAVTQEGAAQRSLVGRCWRGVFLAATARVERWDDQSPLREELDDSINELDEALSRFAAGISSRDVQSVEFACDLSFLATELTLVSRDLVALDQARSIVARLSDLRREDGSFPAAGAAAMSPATEAKFAIAAARVGCEEPARGARSALLAKVDDEKRLVATRGPSGVRYELSPTVPLALLFGMEDPDQVDDALDPPAPDPPSFRIASVSSDHNSLSYTIRTEGKKATRRFAQADFDLMLHTFVERISTVDPDQVSARQHAHIAMSLDRLIDASDCDLSRAEFDRLRRRALSAVLDKQAANGGFQYSYVGVPSVVYGHGTRGSTAFPDRQYTLDAAVTGIALCRAFGRTGDERFGHAARALLRFFESEIGRVPWAGQYVWRLFPGDQKTERTGTAVNYELWIGLFFAEYQETVAGPDERARLRRYLDDIVGYASGHLHENGDVAYGDYVQEKRAAYAAWDAFLLAEISARAGLRHAGEMSRKIVTRLGETMLPSGALPNVAEHFELLNGRRRWLVHRHGIGPYPIRGYYQAYCAVACAAAGAAPDAGLKALGFVLIALLDPVYGNVASGFDGKGAFIPGRIPGDWLCTAAACLPAISAFRYRPRLTRRPAPRERLGRVLEDAYVEATALSDGAVKEPPEVQGEIDVDLGRGSAALWRTTSDERWFERAVRHLQAALTNEVRDVALPLLALELWSRTHDGQWLRMAKGLAPGRSPEQTLEAVSLEVRLVCAGVAGTAGIETSAAREETRRALSGVGTEATAASARTLLAALDLAAVGVLDDRTSRHLLSALARSRRSVDPRPRRNGGPAKRVPPGSLAAYVLVFARAAEELAAPGAATAGERLFRELLVHFRSPSGFPASDRDRWHFPEPLVHASVFSHLAQVHEVAPAWLAATA